MIHLYYTKLLASFDPVYFHHLLEKLPPAIQNKILKFRKWEDRQRSLLGKMLLIDGLKSYGYSNSLDALKYSAFDKPYFDQSIHFNISHSGTYTICAISDTNKIGVDIEEVKEIPLVDFDNEFSKEELKKIHSAENPLQQFYTLWTQKEAFLKAIGEGLNVPLNEVVIVNDKIIWKKEEWFLKEINIVPAYIAHLSTDAFDAIIEMKEISF
jgi:4'-phosphopantetheinyl transferase